MKYLGHKVYDEVNNKFKSDMSNVVWKAQGLKISDKLFDELWLPVKRPTWLNIIHEIYMELR